jgi:hypothetical protein
MIKKITKQGFDQLLNHPRRCFGLFYFKDGRWYIAVDNTKGDCIVEQFRSFDECRSWLKGARA